MKVDYRWWKADKEQLHSTAMQAFKDVKEADTARREYYEDYARMYSNLDYLGISPSTFSKSRSKDRVTLNVIQMVADTVVARIARSRIRPEFLTDKGNHSTRRKADVMTRFVEAQFYLSKAHEIMPQVMLDAAVFGTGVARVYRRGEEIRLERVLPSEVFVDPTEAFYGKPRTLYYRKFVNKEVLKAHFPKKAAMIDMLQPARGSDAFRPANDSHNDMLVEVLECFHLPSKDGQGDGKRALVTENCTLEESSYTHECFPFVFLRYRTNLMGFFGKGVAENLTSLQKEINRILITIQKSFRLLAVPWVFVEQGSSVKTHQLSNHPGTIIKYRGSAPVVKPNQTVHPEVLNHLDRLKASAFEQEGISPELAQGQKPAGLSSGAAIRAAEDVQTAKFGQVLKAYEEAHLELARWVIRMAREIQEENPKWSVVAQRDKHTIDTIKFSEIDLEDEAYVLKVFPASALPTTPAGRLAMVSDMLNLGLLDPETAKRLLDFPDLEHQLALDRAASDHIDRVVEQMLDEGIYEGPEPFQDHQLALKKVQAAYNKAIVSDVPDDRLQLLRNYMTATNNLQKAALQEQAALSAPPVGGAPAPVGFDGAPQTALQAEDGTVPF